MIDVNGVGYEVHVPASTLAKLPAVGKVARVHTRMVVRDDAMTLYGFATPDERELFDLLVDRDRGRAEGRAVVPLRACLPTRCVARSRRATSPR